MLCGGLAAAGAIAGSTGGARRGRAARPVADAGRHTAALERARASAPQSQALRTAPTAGRCAPSSTPRPTGFDSRRSSPRRRRRARSTTSRSRRSSADKTQPRADQAWRIRALGPAFHALAEINVTGWTAWVATTGSSWYAAGVEARRRMAAAGYDVAAGDTWALNELSSAVRQGTAARARTCAPSCTASTTATARCPPRAAPSSSPGSASRPPTSPSTRRGCRTGTRTRRSGTT